MMEARYYATTKKSTRHRHPFRNDESMLAFLTEKSKGELFLEDMDGFKIKYDTDTGKVKLVSAEQTTDKVRVFFSPEISQPLTRPISDAIRLLSKFDLLLKLDAFHDEKISSLIAKNHKLRKTGKFHHIDHSTINKTLGQIWQFCHPKKTFLGLKKKDTRSLIQKAICRAFSKSDHLNIQSLDNVHEIMKRIRSYLAEHAQSP